MKIKTNYLSGLYKITRIPSVWDGKTEQWSEEDSFEINLTSLEAKTLMKRPVNDGDSLYSRLGFQAIELVERY